MPLLFVAANEGTFQKKTRLVALDISDGKTVWETEKLPGTIVDAFPAYEENLVVMVTVPLEGPRSELDVMALVFATGQVAFQTHIDEKADLYISDSSGKFVIKFDLSGHAQPVIHGELVISSAKGVLRAFDRKTGALKWTSQNFGAGVAGMLVNGNVLFGRMGGMFIQTVAKEWELKKPLGVVAVNVDDGKTMWMYDKAKDSITNMAMMPDGQTVLIADQKHLTGLTRQGQEAFRIPVEFKKGMTAGKFAAGALKVGIAGVRGLGGGDKSAEDAPVAVIPRGETGMVAVRSKQALLAFDTNKKEIAWSAMYEAPGVSGWQKLAMAAVTAMAYAYYTGKAASPYAGTSQNYWANNQRVNTIQNYNRFASKRFSATKQGRGYVYILTDIEKGKAKGPGLVGVNLDTGSVDREILLNEKQPGYEVDEATGMLFRVIKKKEITGTLIQ